MKANQCPIEQAHKQAALAELGALAATGVIELYLGDESGCVQCAGSGAGVAVREMKKSVLRRRKAKD